MTKFLFFIIIIIIGEKCLTENKLNKQDHTHTAQHTKKCKNNKSVECRVWVVNEK